MTYLAGDNNLSDNGLEDLDEMRQSGGSTKDVAIVAQFDSSGNGRTRRYLIQGSGNDLVEQFPETDSGDPHTLVDFVQWAALKYPAERYALVLWNHGSGWKPDEISRVSRTGPSRTALSLREIVPLLDGQLGRTFFRSSIRTIVERKTLNERAILSDDGTGHSLDMIELKSVLEKARSAIGRRFDLLGMDACLMNTLEVGFQVQEYAKLLVGSEELEPGDGWPYDRVLRALTAKPTMTGEELARTVVDEYDGSYADLPDFWPVTMAAVDLDLVGPVAVATSQLAAALTAAMPGARNDVQDVQLRCWRSLRQYQLYDMKAFCSGLDAHQAIPPKVKTAAQAVLKALDAYTLDWKSHGNQVKTCGGTSIYFPDPFGAVSPYYKDLAFAKKTAWDDWIAKYHALSGSRG